MVVIRNWNTEKELFRAEMETLAGTRLDRLDLKGANLQDADLTGASLRATDLQGAFLWGATLEGADLRHAGLTAANCTGANLERANLLGASMDGCILAGARLAGSDLREASLVLARLENVDLTGADLRGALLLTARLTGANLQDVRWDEHTVWPENFDQSVLGTTAALRIAARQATAPATASPVEMPEGVGVEGAGSTGVESALAGGSTNQTGEGIEAWGDFEGSQRPCPGCGRSVSVDALHCPACRERFERLRPCGACARPLSAKAISCPGCGHPAGPAPAADKSCGSAEVIQLPAGSHSVAVAVLVSALCCAVGGQLYNQQYLKGAVFAACHMLLALVTMGASMILTYPLLMIDTALIAGRLHRGEPVSQWQCF